MDLEADTDCEQKRRGDECSVRRGAQAVSSWGWRPGQVRKVEAETAARRCRGSGFTPRS
ncbi:MAG: hypothetical protein GY772_10240 [bacterium]|nr:hypothetical protein [bacterium]